MYVCMYIYIYIERERDTYTGPIMRSTKYEQHSKTVHVRVLSSFQQPTLEQLQMGIDIQMPFVFETCSCNLFQVKL